MADRSVALVVRLTEAERAAWHAAARSGGWGKTAAWVRELVSARLAVEPVVPRTRPSRRARSLERDQVAVLTDQVRGLGNNVNQIARALNRIKAAPERAFEDDHLGVLVEALRRNQIALVRLNVWLDEHGREGAS